MSLITYSSLIVIEWKPHMVCGVSLQWVNQDLAVTSRKSSRRSAEACTAHVYRLRLRALLYDESARLQGGRKTPTHFSQTYKLQLISHHAI